MQQDHDTKSLACQVALSVQSLRASVHSPRSQKAESNLPRQNFTFTIFTPLVRRVLPRVTVVSVGFFQKLFSLPKVFEIHRRSWWCFELYLPPVAMVEVSDELAHERSRVRQLSDIKYPCNIRHPEIPDG